MGRRKIEIKAIKDDRNRSVTFLKRKGGLFKKAHELSVLCSVDVAVFVFGNNKKLYEYSSIDMRELIARYQYHGGPSEHKGPSDFNGGAQDDDDDDDAEGTPPRGLNGMEAHMMPPHFQGQPQPQIPPPPPPFSQPRHHTASASPPMSNGPFPGRQPHVQRGHTPQPPITSKSRPASRGDMRRMSMGPGMAARQPAGPHHHAPHLGMAYMAAPPPVFNQPGSLMPPGPSYPYQPPQQPPQQQQQQQPYMEERRPSGPSGFATQQQPPSAQGVPAIAQTRPSPPQPHPQSLHHQPPPNHIHHSSPQPERRHLDPQHPPPLVDLRPGSSDRSMQPFGSTDMAVKRLPQRKSHSIFTPIEENRSILSLHLASFASEPPVKVNQVTMEPVKTDAGTPAVVPAPGPGHRSSSADSGPSGRSAAKKASPLLAQRSSARNSSISSAAETTASPPAQSGSLKVGVPGGGRVRGPRLTVQIPDGSSEVESATGGSISPRNIVESPVQAPQRPNSTAVVLPPPSPSAQTLLSAGAIGPPNPFARPPPQQNINGETPVSALPSRFLNTELLPSPNSFYTEWNFRAGDSNTLPSPLNFTTPVVGTGPSFLRDDAHSSSNGAATTSALLTSAATTTTASSIVGSVSSSVVSVPTITTTAASESMPPATSGRGKRKSPESDGDGEASRDAPETGSDPKRLRVS